jgi:putative ATPase
VPAHLRNATTPLDRRLGFGAAYQYPHDFEGHYVPERYLPEALRDRRYYTPSASGREREIAERLAALRARGKPGQ